jgi:hypothetical protein
LALEREEASAQDSVQKRAKARVRRESEEDGVRKGVSKAVWKETEAAFIIIMIIIIYNFVI